MYQTDVRVIPIFIERKCKSLYITECNYSSSRRNLRRISPVRGSSSADSEAEAQFRSQILLQIAVAMF